MRSKLVPLVRNPLLTLSSLILIAHCNVVWMQLLQLVGEKIQHTQADSCPSVPVQRTLVQPKCSAEEVKLKKYPWTEVSNHNLCGQYEVSKPDLWTGGGKQARYDDRKR